MTYTIAECDKYLDELTDKLGSDYFPIDIKFGRFVTMTYDFIRNNSNYLETSQEISDDLKNILIRRNHVMNATSVPGVYEIAEPADYFRLISVEPFARVNGVDVKKFKKVNIIKEGQRIAYERDPFREPSSFYPSIFRIANIFEVNVGNDPDPYLNAKVSFLKKPTFGDINDDNARILNLSDIAIEQILLKTAQSLRFTTGDETAASVFQFDQAFGKRNR